MFLGYNTTNSISAGVPPQNPLGKLTALSRPPSWVLGGLIFWVNQGLQSLNPALFITYLKIQIRIQQVMFMHDFSWLELNSRLTYAVFFKSEYFCCLCSFAYSTCDHWPVQITETICNECKNTWTSVFITPLYLASRSITLLTVVCYWPITDSVTGLQSRLTSHRTFRPVTPTGPSTIY